MQLTLLLIGQLSGDIEWKETFVETIISQCEDVLNTDENLWTETDDGEPELPDVLEKFCDPPDCNERGTCVEGIRIH